MVVATTCCTAAVCLGAACSSSPAPATAGQYCAAISDNLDQLKSPAIVDVAGIEATSKLYRSITSIAPLAVQKEWQTMTSNVETAATVDPNDPASLQLVADSARSSQNAATTISDYTTKLCGVTIGAPATTVTPVVDTTSPP
jgi:hypothetical protein